MDTNTYTLKEVMESNFAEMRTHLQDIKIQTTRTNGRVMSLEKSRIQIWTSMSILVVLGGTIITLAIMAIDSKIEKGIAKALADNVSKIEYEK